MNKFRVTSGEGRSQAFGFSRRASYRPWISRQTWKRMALYKLLVGFAERNSIVGWDAIQVNQNYQTATHKDTGNQGDSYIVGFGDYTGGELVVNDEKVDIRHRGYTFNGADLPHSTCAFDGTRYSIVFFQIKIPDQFLLDGAPWKVTCRLLPDNELEITDDYNGSVIVLNKRGKVARILREGVERPWIGLLTSLKSRS